MTAMYPLDGSQLPVLKGLLRALNNQRIGATGTIATYIPLRSNIEFHKVCTPGRIVFD